MKRPSDAPLFRNPAAVPGSTQAVAPRLATPRHAEPACLRIWWTLLWAAILLGGAGQAAAATYTWDSDGADANGATDGSGTWSTTNLDWFANNTTPDIGWTNNTTDVAAFGTAGSTGGTVTVSGSFSAGGILFDGADSAGYTLAAAGSTLTLGASGIVVQSGAGAQSFNSGLTLALAANQAWTNSSANPLAVSGAITLGATQLTFNGAGNTTLGGAITGAGTLWQTGAGTLTLSAANTAFTGNLTIDAGTVAYTADTNLGSTTAGSISSITLNGGTLNQTSNSSAFATVHAYNIGAAGGTFNLAGTGPGTGSKIQFNTAGQISGSGTITKTGGADMWLTAAQTTFTGAWNINAGFVEVTNANALGSGPVTINSGGELVDSNGVSIANLLTLNNGSVLSVDNSGTGTYTGAVSLNGAVSMIPSDFYGANAGRLMKISGSISGTGGITVTDTQPVSGFTSTSNGTLTLSGVNSFTGNTTVTSGILDLANAAALQGSTLTTGGTGLVFDSTVAANAFTLGGLSGAANLALQNNATTPAAIALTIGSSFNSSSSTYSGTLSGAGSLIKAASGTLILTGANTYTGATTISGGTLQIGNGTSGSLNGAAGTALTFTGTGTINFDEAGSSTQAMGTLTPTAGDGTVQSTFVATGATLTFANVATRIAGAGLNFVTSGGSSTTNQILLTNFSGSTTPTGVLLNAGEFFGGSAYAAYDAAGFVRAYATTDANSATAAAGSNTIAGTATSNVFVTGAVTGQNAAAVNTINLAANNVTLATATTLLQTNGLLASGGTNIMLTSGELEPTASGGELVVRVNGSTDKLTIGSLIQNNTTASSLTKLGAGTLVLSGTNTFSGGLFVDNGIVQFTAEANLGGTGSPITLNGGTLNQTSTTVGFATTHIYTIGAGGGTFNFASNAIGTGAKITISTANRIVGSGTLTKTGNADINITQGQSFTGNWIINGGFVEADNTTALGSGTVIVNSTGQLVVNAQTVANTLIVNGGVLSSDNAATGTFSGPISLSGSATFIPAEFFSSTTATKLVASGVISGTGSITVTLTEPAAFGGTVGVGSSSAGIVILSGTNTFSGGTIITSGTVQVGNAGATGTLGSGNVTDNATLTFNRTDVNLNVGNIISGTGVVQQIGSGTTTLSGANTYTGATSILAGTLSVVSISSVAAPAASGLGAPTTVANGTITIGSTTTTGQLSYTGAGATTDRIINLAGTTGGAAIDSSGAGPVVFTSNFTATGAGSKTLTLQGSNVGLNTIQGAIVDNGGANTTTVAKAGLGTWVLSGPNTFSGGLSIANNGGNLVATSVAALGSGPITISKSGTNTGTLQLQLTGVNTITNTFNGFNSTTTTGSTTVPDIENVSGNNTITSNLTVTGTGGNGITISSDSGLLTLQGILSTTITAREVELNGAGNGLVSGTIVDGPSAPFELIKDGAGVWTLSGANTYSNATQINSGTLQLAGAGTLGSTSGALALNGGVLDLDGTNQGVGKFSGNAAGNVLNSASGTSVLTIGNGDNGGGAFAGVIADNAGSGGTVALVKTGAGVETLTGANTFSGGVATQNGVLAISAVAASGSPQPLGENGLLSLGAGGASGTTGTLQYTGPTANLTQNVTLAGPGAISNTGGGTLTLSGTLTKANATLTLAGGALNVTGQITGGTSADFNSDLAINAGASVTLANVGNNYTGPTTISGGSTLLNGAGVANVLPTGTVLTLGASTDAAVTNTYDLGGNDQTLAALNSVNNGSGTNVNLVTNSGASGGNTLSITGVNSDGAAVNSNFSGTIRDGANASTALALTGGTLVLGGSGNTYSGGTRVTGGTLQVANTSSAGSATGSGAVSVGTSGSGATLAGPSAAGQGFISGPVTIGGVGTLAASNSTAAAALTLSGGLTFNSGATASLTLNSNAPNGTSNPLINVSGGSFSVGGSSSVNITFNNAAAVGNGQTYDLFGYVGSAPTIGSGGLMLNVTNGPGGFQYSLTTATAGQVDLTIMSPSLVWTGFDGGASATPDSTWSTTNPGANWANGSMPTTYSDGASVVFGDTNPTGGSTAPNPTVTIAGTVSPNSVTFNNHSVSYTLSGGTISGANTTITLNGGGSVDFTGLATNSYTGATTVNNASTLIFSADNQLGSGSGAGNIVLGGDGNGGTLRATGGGSFALSAGRGIYVGQAGFIGNGTIDVASGTTLTVPGPIVDNVGGIGSLIIASSGGSGTLILTGVNTYSGSTTVNAGATLQIGNGLGTGTLGSGDVTTNSIYNPTTGLGGLIFDTGTSSTVTNNLGGSGSVTLIGSGTIVTLTPTTANTYSGGTNIVKFTLKLGNNNALPSGTAVTFGGLGANGTLDLNGHSATVGGLATDPSATAGNQSILNNGGSAATLTFAGTGSPSTFGGTIQDSGQPVALAVTGGSLTITGNNNTYSGGTMVTGGTLVVNSPSSAANGAIGSAPVLVGDGIHAGSGTLTGGGFIGGSVIGTTVTTQSGGTIAGTSGQTLTINDTLNLNSGSTATFNLTAPNSSSTGLIAVTGTLSVSGTPAVTLVGTSTLISGDTYDVLSYPTNAGISTSSFSLPNTFGSFNLNWTTPGNDELLLTVSTGSSGNTPMNAVNYWSASPPGSNLQFGATNNWSVQSNNGYVNIQSTIQPGIAQASGSPGTGGPFLLTDQGTSASPNQGNPLYASILAGTNSGSFGTSGGAAVTMSWRARAKQETDPQDGGTPSSPPLQYVGSYLISNVLNLNGLGTSGAANQSATYNNATNTPYFGAASVTEHETDPFVLQMNYNVPLLSNEAAQAKKGTIYLGWLAPAGLSSNGNLNLAAPTWEKAFTGDFNLTTGAQDGSKGTDAVANFQGSFLSYLNSISDSAHGFNGGFTQGSIASLTNAQLDQILGAYGVDPSSGNHDVWAVINHNSQFAVVPEPSTLLLAALGLAGLAGYRVRRRRS